MMVYLMHVPEANRVKIGRSKHIKSRETRTTKRATMYFDNGKIQVYLGVTGWCFTVTLDSGKKSGGVGYGSFDAALQAARNK